LQQTEVNGLLLPAVLMDGLRLSEGDAGVGRDDVCDLAHAEGNRRVVVALLGRRYHGAAYVAHLGVVEDALEAVADLNAASPRSHDEEHQDATVGPLGAYLPLLLEGGGELFDGLVAVKGFDGDNSDLGVGLPVDLGAEALHALPGLGREDVGKVIDVARRRWKRGHRLRREKGSRGKKQKNND